jgi:hypothetical protein
MAQLCTTKSSLVALPFSALQRKPLDTIPATAILSLATALVAPKTPTLAVASLRRAQSVGLPASTLRRASDPQFSPGGVPYPVLLPSCTAQCNIQPVYSLQYYWERVAYTTTWAAGNCRATRQQDREHNKDKH